MRVIWGLMMMLGIVGSILSGSGDKLLDVALSAAGNAVTLAITLVAAYALWMGVMNIASEAGLVKSLAKVLKPIIKVLFKGTEKNKKAQEYVTLNLSANVLGLGNAATPYGICAMEEMQKQNKNKKIATNAMCMLLIVNASSVQIMPTTIMALRASAGSAQPAEIALPALIATLVNTITAVIIAKFMEKRF